MNKESFDQFNLSSIERVSFDDLNVAFDIDGNAGKAYRLYEAAFDRDPDLEGLGYWISALDKGTSLESVAKVFIDSDEFHNLYGSNISNEEFVTSMYQNTLDRAPDQGGFDYWVNELGSGSINEAQGLAYFSESNENQLNVIGVIQDGIEYKEWVE